MRFMIIVMASSASEAGVTPTEAKLKEMGDFHAELARAGALIDGSGLQATAKGWRVHYDGAKRTVVDGPFAETKELIAGYTLIRTDTREEAVAWSRRFPNPNLDDSLCHIEVRQMFGSSRIPGERSLDLEEEVGRVAEAVGHALDHFDAVIDAFEQAGVHWVDGAGQDAAQVGADVLGEAE